jgi:hypothetical protein
MEKRGACPYCAAEDVELTIEHVFPESWYPDGFSQADMFKGPACKPCNHSHGKIEGRLFLTLVESLPEDPRADSIVARARRSAEPMEGRSVRDTFHRSAKQASFRRRLFYVGPNDPLEGSMWLPAPPPIGPQTTPVGVHVYGTPVLPLAWEDLEAVAIKLFKGCYFRRVGSPLPAGTPCRVIGFEKDPRELMERWRAIPGNEPVGAFPFVYSLSVLGDREAAGFFVLWAAIILFVSSGDSDFDAINEDTPDQGT